MEFPKLISKTISVTIAVVFFATNCALAYSSESNFWKQRQKHVQRLKNQTIDSMQLASLPAAHNFSNPDQILQKLPSLHASNLSLSVKKTLDEEFAKNASKKYSLLIQSLPYQYGNVRKISLPPKGKEEKTVVLIQDIHLHSEAQKNIGSTIRELIKKKKVGLIALEGAFRPIDLSAFRKIPEKEIVRQVADYLLRENKISGAVHTAFTSPTDIPPFLGVDHPSHYAANVQAYKNSASLVKNHKKYVARLQKELKARKKRTFNPSLIQFDRLVDQYQRGEISLSQYLRQLRTLTLQGPKKEGGGPNTKTSPWTFRKPFIIKNISGHKNLLGGP